MLTVGQEDYPLTEIDVGSEIRAVTFKANGEYIYIVDSSGRGRVGVWKTANQWQ